ncbi:MAG: alpha/beta hydrolase [Alphaproteobacteria bacterium]
MNIRRDFIDTPQGQLHVVTAGPAAETAMPLVMIPQMSALEQVRLMVALGERPTIAIDPLGLGDSDPVPWSQPTMADYAGVLLTALSALKIERFDLYGSHFGARAATEMAVLAPKRVRRLILDGAGHMDAAQREDLAKNYVPPIAVDQHGSQIRWSWHFVRDSFLYWPYFRREAKNSRIVGLPSAEALHDRTVHALKNVRSLDKNFRAAFEYPTDEKLPQVACPTLLGRLDAACAALIPKTVQTDHDFYDSAESDDAAVDAWASSIASFLDNS